MKQMTNPSLKKIKAVVEDYLSEPSGDGGYPPDFAYLGKHLIIADVDQDEPHLRITTIKELYAELVDYGIVEEIS